LALEWLLHYKEEDSSIKHVLVVVYNQHAKQFGLHQLGDPYG